MNISICSKTIVVLFKTIADQVNKLIKHNFNIIFLDEIKINNDFLYKLKSENVKLKILEKEKETLMITQFLNDLED